MSRILVTGASGFVGRALCRSLSAQDIAHAPVFRCPEPECPVGVCVGDIGGTTDWSDALVGIDRIVHLAARVHVMGDRAVDPLSAHRAINTEGTLNLARQAAASGVRRFLFVSSVKVNGEGRPTPYTEADAPMPGDPYALSKCEAEDGLRSLAESTGMEVVILRPPLVYGPGVGANFRRMMQTLASGWPLPFARIDNRRSLVFVGNLVSAIECCLVHPQAANRTFLVSDGEDVSTPDLLRRLGAALQRPARLIPVPVGLLKAGLAVLGREAQAERLCGSLQVDASALRDALDWVPPFGLDAGLRETARDFLAQGAIGTKGETR